MAVLVYIVSFVIFAISSVSIGLCGSSFSRSSSQLIELHTTRSLINTQSITTTLLILQIISALPNTTSPSITPPQILVETPVQSGTINWAQTYQNQPTCAVKTLTQTYDTSLITLGSVSWMRLTIRQGSGSLEGCNIEQGSTAPQVPILSYERELMGFFSPPIQSTIPVVTPILKKVSLLSGIGYFLLCSSSACPFVEEILIAENAIQFSRPSPTTSGTYSTVTLVSVSDSEYMSEPYIVPQ